MVSGRFDSQFITGIRVSNHSHTGIPIPARVFNRAEYIAFGIKSMARLTTRAFSSY